MNQKSAVPGYIVMGVGVVLLVIGIYWGAIEGFYQHELPMLLGVLGGGVLFTWLGQRMLQAVKRGRIEQRIAERDAEGTN